MDNDRDVPSGGQKDVHQYISYELYNLHNRRTGRGLTFYLLVSYYRGNVHVSGIASSL
jgi:hypothetical protein